MRFTINTENSGNICYPRESIFVEDIWGTYLEPDMMFVSAELEEKMGERRSSADIIFECLSESTGVYDRTTKADTNLGLGVKELWLVDADKQEIEFRNADVYENGRIWKKRIYQKGETAESRVLENWKIPVSEVFAK